MLPLKFCGFGGSIARASANQRSLLTGDNEWFRYGHVTKFGQEESDQNFGVAFESKALSFLQDLNGRIDYGNIYNHYYLSTVSKQIRKGKPTSTQGQRKNTSSS